MMVLNIVAANMVKSGNRALIVNTGYFGIRCDDVFEQCGVKPAEGRASTIDDVSSLVDAEFSVSSVNKAGADNQQQ